MLPLGHFLPLDIKFRCAIGLFSLLNSDFLSVSSEIGGVFERMQKHAADAEACLSRAQKGEPRKYTQFGDRVCMDLLDINVESKPHGFLKALTRYITQILK